MKISRVTKHFAILTMAIGLIITMSSYAPNSHSKSSDNEDLALLRYIVQEMQSELPMDVGSGMIISEVYITSSNFVMESTCSDNMMSLLSLSSDVDAKYEFLQGVLSDEASTLLLTICADAGLGAKFIFADKSCTRRLKVEYSAAELKNYFN